MCCTSKNVESTELEMLPAAMDLFRTGMTADKLEAEMIQRDNSVCYLFERDTPDGNLGRCLNYSKRALICRLFGFMQRINRLDQSEFMPCRIHKITQPAIVDDIHKAIANKHYKAPSAIDWTIQLKGIAPSMAKQEEPINQALIKALSRVETYYSYWPEDQQAA
jgi:Fe-S-cluster containining protein